VDDHRLIADAIRRRDAEAAEAAVRLHLHHAYGAIVAAAPPADLPAQAPLPADKPRIGKRKRGPA
jgi:DNA-binding GntR family transcriptional regulator